MIPTIEQIVEDVKAGTITTAQAVSWLHAHAEGVANDLRDHFAAMAMQGLLSNINSNGETLKKYMPAIALEAYQFADAMLKAKSV